MTQTGIIFDIKKYAINDGPGIRTTVFMQGCPLSCWWCHNPESRSLAPTLMYRSNRCVLCGECAQVCPQNAIQIKDTALTDRTKCDICGICAQACYHNAREISGQEVSVEELMAEIKRDTPFHDQSGGGVTFSGGEPLIQPSFLLALLRACRQQEIHTVVDTSGYASWKTLDSIREYVDLFLYDMKLIDDQRHQLYTGVSNVRILANLRKLAKFNHPVHVRIPLIPGINDDEENLRKTGEFLEQLPAITRVELIGYHKIASAKYQALGIPYRLNGTRPPSAEQKQSAGEILGSNRLDVKIS